MISIKSWGALKNITFTTFIDDCDFMMHCDYYCTKSINMCTWKVACHKRATTCMKTFNWSSSLLIFNIVLPCSLHQKVGWKWIFGERDPHLELSFHDQRNYLLYQVTCLTLLLSVLQGIWMSHDDVSHPYHLCLAHFHLQKKHPMCDI